MTTYSDQDMLEIIEGLYRKNCEAHYNQMCLNVELFNMLNYELFRKFITVKWYMIPTILTLQTWLMNTKNNLCNHPDLIETMTENDLKKLAFAVQTLQENSSIFESGEIEDYAAMVADLHQRK